MRLVVADSFLLLDGHVDRLEAHRHRFRQSVRQLLCVTPPDLHAQLPSEGCWFPRIEAYEDASFHLNLRPAPKLRTYTRLWIPEQEDPRRYPLHKGPDLDALAALRAQAQERGCDDAVLHRDGVVIEAAHASLTWWDGRNWILPPMNYPHLPAISTLGLKPVVRRTIRLEEAAELPAFALNSLHGTTKVSAWHA